MAKNQTAKSNKPTHRLYVVTGEGDNAFWQQIGAAWPHQDGDGFNMVFDAFPITGRIVARRIEEKEAAA